jgi:hypothetical protein
MTIPRNAAERAGIGIALILASALVFFVIVELLVKHING